MAYVQVKLLQALKIAAITVAFFSSFIHAVDTSTLDFSQFIGVNKEEAEAWEIIKPIGQCPELNEHPSLQNKQEELIDTITTDTLITKKYNCLYDLYIKSGCAGGLYCKKGATNIYGTKTVVLAKTVTEKCPPATFTPPDLYVPPLVPGLCYKLRDLKLIDEYFSNELNEDEKCKELILDSGNNTADALCYSDIVSGRSCNVTKVTVGDGTYYKGESNSDGGCFTSEHPPFDDTGLGDKKDGCIYSEGTNYCKANRDKHCKVIQGAEICDDGCIDDGTDVFCDITKHPDVGEDDSDYFDDDGTCSVIAGSSSKGYCEEMGGEWDKANDHDETSCPSGGGTCSIAVSGYCQSCFDAGGTWTPDDSPITDKSGIEIAALIKKSNEKLAQVEHGQRKTMESLQSTMKSGSGKVVDAIEALGDKLDKQKEEEEKESFTTTTADVDKTAFNSLFDEESKAVLETEIDKIKNDMTIFIQNTKAEATALMSITVPSASGYQARNLTLTQGTFDMSLSRFSDFFKMLATPILLLCSILAGFILLGRKD